MKVKAFWIPLAALAALVLGALLFRGCGKVKTVTYCPPVNVDSLIGTLPRDTVIIPGEQVVVNKTRIVNLKDTAEVNQLRRELEDNARYAAAQLEALRKALGEAQVKRDSSDSLAAWNMIFRTSVWEDSVRTAQYFHRWHIEAEGPITAYTFGIVPICPPIPTIPKTKNHHAGLYLGGQMEGGAIRPVYTVRYGYKFLSVQGAYLPRSVKLGNQSAFQVSAGFDVPIR